MAKTNGLSLEVLKERVGADEPFRTGQVKDENGELLDIPVTREDIRHSLKPTKKYVRPLQPRKVTGWEAAYLEKYEADQGRGFEYEISNAKVKI